MGSAPPQRLAVVGSREFSAWWHEGAARGIIGWVLDRYSSSIDLVVSGGADGVDTWAVEEAEKRGVEFEEWEPVNRCWEPNGFKERNMIIAMKCTHLLSIRSKDAKTYGSGWTADYAEEIGKKVQRVLL